VAKVVSEIASLQSRLKTRVYIITIKRKDQLS